MHELDDDGTFADARGNTLYRTVADIADHKDARDVRFEQAGIAVESPGSGALAVVEEVRTGEDKAALVALDKIAKPLSAGLRADENEETRSRELFTCTAGLALHGYTGEAGIALDFDDAGLCPDFNAGRLFDLLNEVVGHGAGERCAANEHDDFVRVFGEVHSSLACGIRAADDVDSFAAAGDGFRSAATIVDASTLEALDTGHIEVAPLNAHGQKESVA